MQCSVAQKVYISLHKNLKARDGVTQTAKLSIMDVIFLIFTYTTQALPHQIDIRNNLPPPSSGRPESIRHAGEDVSL